LRRASCPSSRPARAASSGSQVAATAVGLGNATEGSSGAHPVPRTPTGPSDITSERSPIRGMAGSDQKSCPPSNETFSSRDSALINSSTARSCQVDLGRVIDRHRDHIVPSVPTITFRVVPEVKIRRSMSCLGGWC
jgi:hypothetical protein